MYRTAEKRFVPHVRLRNPFPLFPCVNSKHPIPARSLRFFPESRSMLYQLCIMVASCPSLRCNCRKSLSYAEKHRVWSWSCGLQDLLQCSDCAFRVVLCDCLQTNEQLSRLSFQQQWVGSGVAGLSAADVRKMCRTAEKRFVPHVRLRNPFPLFLVLIPSIQSLPEAWGSSWEPQPCSTSSALWLHHAHPFVVTAEKAFLMQRSGAASLSATYVPKMWRAAKKRWNRHLCLRNPCFCGNLSLHSV